MKKAVVEPYPKPCVIISEMELSKIGGFASLSHQDILTKRNLVERSLDLTHTQMCIDKIQKTCMMLSSRVYYKTGGLTDICNI